MQENCGLTDGKKYSRCLRCNRILKNEDAQRVGMGKVCFEKYKKENCHKQIVKKKSSEQNFSEIKPKICGFNIKNLQIEN